MHKLVLLRHGESTWNLENRFTGWTDVDLSDTGYREAHAAGRLLRNAGYSFDLAFVSVLRRAILTLWEVQKAMDMIWLPTEKDWRLNERHYGALQGLNKAEIAEHYGTEQVHQWRRGYAVRPPALKTTDPRHPRFDARYRRLADHHLPDTESLADTMERVLEVWHERIKPRMRAGNRILIAAHGNTLRALVKHLDDLSDEAVMELNIPTGAPLVYDFNNALQITARYYLTEEHAIPAALRAAEPIQVPAGP